VALLPLNTLSLSLSLSPLSSLSPRVCVALCVFASSASGERLLVLGGKDSGDGGEELDLKPRMHSPEIQLHC